MLKIHFKDEHLTLADSYIPFFKSVGLPIKFWTLVGKNAAFFSPNFKGPLTLRASPHYWVYWTPLSILILTLT